VPDDLRAVENQVDVDPSGPARPTRHFSCAAELPLDFTRPLKYLPCRKSGGANEDQVQKIASSWLTVDGISPEQGADPGNANGSRKLIDRLPEMKKPVSEVASQRHDN